jgi:Family of unknown function (DUF6166)
MAEGKIYRGERTIDGVLVTADGQPIDEGHAVRTYTDHGLEWSYEGDGPQQLALAILFDHFGEPEKALALAEPFMRRVVANFDNDWEMTSADVERALENIRAAA